MRGQGTSSSSPYSDEDNEKKEEYNQNVRDRDFVKFAKEIQNFEAENLQQSSKKQGHKHANSLGGSSNIKHTNSMGSPSIKKHSQGNNHKEVRSAIPNEIQRANSAGQLHKRTQSLTQNLTQSLTQ
eukprot:Pgem_evm1s3030